MKGCLSYEIVRLMGAGLAPQEACDQAVYDFEARLKKRYGKAGAFSLIALDKQGRWGVATNVEFTFSVATTNQEPAILWQHQDLSRQPESNPSRKNGWRRMKTNQSAGLTTAIEKTNIGGMDMATKKSICFVKLECQRVSWSIK